VDARDRGRRDARAAGRKGNMCRWDDQSGLAVAATALLGARGRRSCGQSRGAAKVACARRAAAFFTVTLAQLATGCAGERAAATFSVLAPGDGTAEVSAAVGTVEELPDNAPVVLAPDTTLPPPDWMDASAVLRMNDVPVQRTGISTFADTLPGFVAGTPVEMTLSAGGDVLVVTPSIEIEPVAVLGPPAGAAHSASEDLTVTLDQAPAGDIWVFLRGAASTATALSSGPAEDNTKRVIGAGDLAAVRDLALSSGAPAGPDGGVELDLVTVGVEAWSGGCDLAHGIELDPCMTIMQVVMDSRKIVLTP
jgi:hypothetical protein